MLLPLALMFALKFPSNFGQTGAGVVADCDPKPGANKVLSETAVMNYLSCNSYLQGFAEGNAGLCIPEGVTSPQMAQVVVKYGADHPERLHWARQRFVGDALSTAFPCR